MSGIIVDEEIYNMLYPKLFEELKNLKDIRHHNNITLALGYDGYVWIWPASHLNYSLYKRFITNLNKLICKLELPFLVEKLFISDSENVVTNIIFCDKHRRLWLLSNNSNIVGVELPQYNEIKQIVIDINLIFVLTESGKIFEISVINGEPQESKIVKLPVVSYFCFSNDIFICLTSHNKLLAIPRSNLKYKKKLGNRIKLLSNLFSTNSTIEFYSLSWDGVFTYFKYDKLSEKWYIDHFDFGDFNGKLSSIIKISIDESFFYLDSNICIWKLQRNSLNFSRRYYGFPLLQLQPTTYSDYNLFKARRTDGKCKTRLPISFSRSSNSQKC